MHLVFTYGTLKKNFHNHHFLENQKFLGKASTIGNKFELYDNGFFPMVVEVKNGQNIEGELYEVDNRCLKRLDYLEGVPHHYDRKIIKVKKENNEEEKAIIYIYQRDTKNLIKYRGTSWSNR